MTELASVQGCVSIRFFGEFNWGLPVQTGFNDPGRQVKTSDADKYDYKKQRKALRETWFPGTKEERDSTVPQEFQMMSKERSSGMYRLCALYISRSASEMPMECLIPSLFVLIIYWTTGLRPTFVAFLSHWAAMMLSLLTAQSVGLVIGASVMDFKKGQTITTLMMLTMMLMGGFYI
ncbi:hypothetical protein BSKO_14136 [Bryopsis sp. KO-2023]|nr:hypothetical protein BSKO_14136 [Bryopsis sp. KO-2023]